MVIPLPVSITKEFVTNWKHLHFPICLLAGATGILDLIAQGTHRCCLIHRFWLADQLTQEPLIGHLDTAGNIIIESFITPRNYVWWNVGYKIRVISWCWLWHLAYLVFVTFISFLSILSSEMTISQHHILFEYTDAERNIWDYFWW